MTHPQVLSQSVLQDSTPEHAEPGMQTERSLGTLCGVFVLSAFFMSVGAFSLAKEAVRGVIPGQKKLVSEPLPQAKPAKPARPKARGRFKIPMLPIDNYNHLDEGTLLGRLQGLSLEELEIVLAYEAKHANRATVLKTITALLAG